MIIEIGDIVEEIESGNHWYCIGHNGLEWGKQVTLRRGGREIKVPYNSELYTLAGHNVHGTMIDLQGYSGGKIENLIF